MKYKYAFVKEVNSFSHDFYYCDELKDLFARYGMSDLYEAKFRDKVAVWTPSMIFKELEKDDYEELCDCSVKEAPDLVTVVVGFQNSSVTPNEF